MSFGGEAVRARTHALLAVATTFLGSLLLFSLEPYVGKLLLPAFGGTPLLWNTCMVFFQVALLLGYLYALLLTRHVSPGRQVVVQLLVLGTLFLAYPDAGGLVEHGGAAPAVRLVATLTRHVLLTFVALAALTTLVQSWFSRSSHAAADNPYRLYAASNAGSMLGLFAYPLLLEPQFSLGEQRIAFLVGLSLVVACVAGMGVTRGRTAAWHAERPIVALPDDETTGMRDRFSSVMWWRVIALTALPASLLLGVTNYVLTDVASLPLFWVIPLALYLATFIVAFGRTGMRIPAWSVRVFTLLCVFIIVALASEATSPAEVLIPMHLVVFTLASLICHVRVASLAPPARQLAQFYVAVSLGGALGGAITLLVPPLLTSRMIEYPIALVLSTLVLAATEGGARRWQNRVADVAILLALVAASVFLFRRFAPPSFAGWSVLAFAPAALFALAANMRGPVFTVRLAVLLLASLAIPSPYGRTLFAERSFYGRVRVTYDAERDANTIVHGSTVHGVELLSKMTGCSPTAYYHPTGPAGRFLSGLAAATTPRRVALIGLGSGALTCYARAGERWDLFELDPVVARVAADTALFTFLAHSPAAEQRLILGDARLALGNEESGRYDLIIVDAFSSDAIPIHLLTREAIAEYVRTLSPNGVLLFHVSNRFFRLPPILAAVSPLFGLEAFDDQDLDLTPQQFAEGKYGSEWVVLARPQEGAALGEQWLRLPRGNARIWTDDYSNPIGAMGPVKEWERGGAGATVLP